jgi:hypothetical protein
MEGRGGLGAAALGEGPRRRVVDAAPFAELGRRILDDDVPGAYIHADVVIGGSIS